VQFDADFNELDAERQMQRTRAKSGRDAFQDGAV
jgi:hypothetical protein